MPKKPLVNLSPRTSLFWVLTATVVALDQFSKRLIEILVPYGSTENFFGISHLYNTGAAFGFLANSSGSRLVLSLISVAGTILVIYIAFGLCRRLSFLKWPSTTLALGIMLGGIVGNMLDRVFIGHVTDFISVWRWPDFNIADSMLVIGNIILAINIIRASGAEHSHDQIGSVDGRQ
ncbi:MAG: signal peptidase II [Dehalococcoidia bacterium]|nr:signal peptidase II [Dehalococcoidia bacterium]